MTFLPKSELVGVLSPSSINTKDIGRIWSAITTGAGVDLIRTICYLGNGISLFGTVTGHVWRSTDYGNTWTDLGDITGAFLVHNICYLGNGIVVLGDDNGHEWRSTDFGVTWTDIGDVSGGLNRNVTSFSYFGNGTAILTTRNQDLGIFSVYIRISTDYGLTWANRRVDDISNGGYESSCYLENGIALTGRTDGHIFRCTDNGNTWTDLGAISTGVIFNITYLGNGIVIFGTNDGHIFRSVDYGATWTDLGAIFGTMLSSSYLGNGIVIASDFSAHIWRSVNFGLSWTDLGVIGTAGSIWATSYLSDGIVLAGGQFTVGATKKLSRSDVAYKLDEAEVLIDSSLITITADITLGQSHNMVNVDTSAGNVTITLPTPSTLQRGHEFVIKNIATSQNIVTIDPGATTIDGFTTPRILTDLEQSLTLRTDGTRYFIKTEYQNFTVGQMKPNVTRYTMPGWAVAGAEVNIAFVNGQIYYVPFFVASTTFFQEFVIRLFANGSAGNVANVRIYSWNDGVPGRLIYDIGAITTDGTIGTPYKTKAIAVFLNRGFYFMAIRNANVGVAPIFVSPNFSSFVQAPVGAMTDSNNPITSDYLDNLAMTVVAAFADPAPAPTAMALRFPIFLLQEN